MNLKEKEIVRLFPDDYRYYAGETIVKKKKEKIEIEQQKDNMLFKDLPPHYKYQVIYPDSSGLYMLAQAALNPINPNEVYFLIKVGQSINLHNRIKSYNGMNPMCIFVDCIKIPSNQLDIEERSYHTRFEARGWIRQNGTEWFVVPKEVYVDFLKNGFKTSF